MLQDVTAEHSVERAGQAVELVERAFAEPRGVGREPLARRRDELCGHVEAEIGEVRPALADQLEHDAGTAAHVEHGGHAGQQLDRLEAGRMVAALVAHAEEILNLRGGVAPPGLSEPHRALLRSHSRRKVVITPEAPSARPRWTRT